MILVVEGTKQSGKSTFIEELKKNSIVPVFNFYNRDLLKFDLKQDDANFASCLSYVKAGIEVNKTMSDECFVVFDRLHLSEIVYGKYARGYNNEKMWIVDEMLAGANARGILFVSDTAEKRTGKKVYKEEFVELAEKSSIRWAMVNLDGINLKYGINLFMRTLGGIL